MVSEARKKLPFGERIGEAIVREGTLIAPSSLTPRQAIEYRGNS